MSAAAETATKRSTRTTRGEEWTLLERMAMLRCPTKVHPAVLGAGPHWNAQATEAQKHELAVSAVRVHGLPEDPVEAWNKLWTSELSCSMSSGNAILRDLNIEFGMLMTTDQRYAGECWVPHSTVGLPLTPSGRHNRSGYLEGQPRYGKCEYYAGNLLGPLQELRVGALVHPAIWAERDWTPELAEELSGGNDREWGCDPEGAEDRIRAVQDKHGLPMNLNDAWLALWGQEHGDRCGFGGAASDLGIRFEQVEGKAGEREDGGRIWVVRRD